MQLAKNTLLSKRRFTQNIVSLRNYLKHLQLTNVKDICYQVLHLKMYVRNYFNKLFK